MDDADTQHGSRLYPPGVLDTYPTVHGKERKKSSTQKFAVTDGIGVLCCVVGSPWRVCLIWMFPKIGVSQNGWFIRENPIKMDDLGVPLFLGTSKS